MSLPSGSICQSNKLSDTSKSTKEYPLLRQIMILSILWILMKQWIVLHYIVEEQEEKPTVTKFEFEESVMMSDSLRIKVFTDYSEEWADFVFANREGRGSLQYDIVYGPIANDKVGLQIRKLKDGAIDKSEFLTRLKYMKGLTYQYYFGTESAIKYLKAL